MWAFREEDWAPSSVRLAGKRELWASEPGEQALREGKSSQTPVQWHQCLRRLRRCVILPVAVAYVRQIGIFPLYTSDLQYCIHFSQMELFLLTMSLGNSISTV